jgi:hypothetical protein
MLKPVSDKMGLKRGARAYFANAPESALNAMKLPTLAVKTTLHGKFDYIHLFTVTQAEMDELFPKLKAHLAPAGTFWVSWPKGRQRKTDLTLPHVIRIGYSHGLVESTALSVDEVWSAIKFTHPKPGKIYNNSYGQVPGT